MRNVYEDLFEMCSNKNMSDFDYIPRGTSEEQIKICEDCQYRWFRIDWDIAKYEAMRKRVNPRLFLNWYSLPKPACNKDSCLIDNRDIRKFIKANKQFILEV